MAGETGIRGEGRYNVTFPPQLNEDLNKLADELSTSKAEIMRKALLLFKHATHADEVRLVTKKSDQSEEIQKVLLK